MATPSSNGVEVALREIFEFRIPFALLGAQQGSRIRLRFAIWRDHLPVDSLPLEGWIDLFAVPEEELENNLYSFAPQRIALGLWLGLRLASRRPVDAAIRALAQSAPDLRWD